VCVKGVKNEHFVNWPHKKKEKGEMRIRVTSVTEIQQQQQRNDKRYI